MKVWQVKTYVEHKGSSVLGMHLTKPSDETMEAYAKGFHSHGRWIKEGPDGWVNCDLSVYRTEAEVQP